MPITTRKSNTSTTEGLTKIVKRREDFRTAIGKKRHAQDVSTLASGQNVSKGRDNLQAITPQCNFQSEDVENCTAFIGNQFSTRNVVTLQTNHDFTTSRKRSADQTTLKSRKFKSVDSEFVSRENKNKISTALDSGECSFQFPSSFKDCSTLPSHTIVGYLREEHQSKDESVTALTDDILCVSSNSALNESVQRSAGHSYKSQVENPVSEVPSASQKYSKLLDFPDTISVSSKDWTFIVDREIFHAQDMGQDAPEKDTQDTISNEVESAGRPASQSNSFNGSPTEELKDPWVPSDSSENITTKKVSDEFCQDGRTGGDMEMNIKSKSMLHKSSSEIELENIQENHSVDEVTVAHKKGCNQVDVQNRIFYDLEMLTRPSWCDATFALSRVKQGKAKGSISSLRLRAFLHKCLFWFGCFIQKHAWHVLSVGILVLGVCAIGLKEAHMETNIENLWVETGGKLSEELEYTRMSLNPGGEAGSSTASSGYSIQMLIQTGDDALSRDSVMLHLNAAMAATEVTVALYNQTWSFSDVCYKQTIPVSGDSTAAFIAPILEKLFPCFIISPLDCFWEGSKLLGPTPPIYISQTMPDVTWTTLHPLSFFDQFLQAATPSSALYDTLLYYRDLMFQAGITTGYQNRWCLDPDDPECPETAPNYGHQKPLDIKKLFDAGCSGFASNLMQWPIDLVIGGIKRNEAGNLTHAQGLQTLFNLMSADNMYEFHKGIKTGEEWSVERAEEILTNWQRNFVEKIYSIAENKNTATHSNDTLNAFSAATANDILIEFSNISFFRVFGGYLLMIGYACLSLMRWRASRSQGAVGVIGVLLVALSVAAGLGMCSFIGISFNAASTQVLPFLLLGLGVDDMFLLAHHFGEISLLSHIPFEERTGECLKRVGVSVFLTSIAILSGFLFSLIIPMPALRAFGLQASIVTVFNLLSVLIIFPSILSLDLLRRKNNKLDILCCFDSSTTNDVIDLTKQNTARNRAYDRSMSHQACAGTPSGHNLTSLSDANGTIHVESGETTTITMHSTIQAFSNEASITVLEPSTEATVSRTSNSPHDDPSHNVEHTNSPPPQYSVTEEDEKEKQTATRHKVAFVNEALSESNASGRSTPATSGSGVKNSRRLNGSNPSTNLTTPMESVRSSTHSLVPQKGMGQQLGDSEIPCISFYGCLTAIPALTISQLGEKYYAPFLLKNPVRVSVIVLFAGLLGASIYGATLIDDGLDFGDVLPRGTREHDAIVAQTTYFAFYNMYIITKEFDYASNQKQLDSLHGSMDTISYVMRNTDGTLTKYWLDYMRDWLQELQQEFDVAWSMGFINATTWTPQASDKAVLAYKLLLQTGKAENPTERGNIGCRFATQENPCKKVDRVRLVSSEGLIPEGPFYNYLTAWVGNDPLAYAASLAEIRPAPPSWSFARDLNMIIPRSPGITYTQMPFYLNNMRENQDFVNVINWVRSRIESVESESSVLAYPSGYPFTFWQQYIDLRFWLFVSLGCVILAVFFVLSIVLFNPWAAFIMAVFLAMIATELLGFMGATNVKLSAVPAVILVASIGLGVEFTVHITFAYITCCGSRKDRVKHSIGHMLGPVIDGSISTLLGVVMLAGAEFDFIITYFFQVLAILILLGFVNGLILLPVVLSFIGPPSEVTPLEGRSRLNTPTPPSTPPPELKGGCSIPHHTSENAESNTNNNCNSKENCYTRCHYTQHFNYRQSTPHHFSSRDDRNTSSRKQHFREVFCQNTNNEALWRRHATHHRSQNLSESGDPRLLHFVENSSRFQAGNKDEQNMTWQQHPFSVPPLSGMDDTDRVIVYPHTKYVVYSNGAPSLEETLQDHHCETNLNPTKRLDPRSCEQPSESEEKQHQDPPILLASSSLTVKVRSGSQPVVSFVEQPGKKAACSFPRQPERVVSRPDEWEKTNQSPSSRTPRRKFDISALTEQQASS